MSSKLVWCDTKPELMRIYFQYILGVINILCILTVIPFTIIFIRRFNQQSRTSRYMFWFTFAFLITVILLFITQSMAQSIFLCYDDRLYSIFRGITGQLYVLQTIELIICLYCRLHFIFQGSFMAISNCAARSFGICSCITTIIAVISVLSYIYYPTISSLMTAIVAIFVIGSIVWLDGWFIYKLRRFREQLQLRNNHSLSNPNNHSTNSRHDESDDELFDIVTKSSVLAWICTLITVVLGITATISSVINSIHWSFIRSLLVSVDVYTNFSCILLNYKHFKPHYYKLCTFCDSQCKGIWMQIDQKKINTVSNEMHELPSTLQSV